VGGLTQRNLAKVAIGVLARLAFLPASFSKSFTRKSVKVDLASLRQHRHPLEKALEASKSLELLAQTFGEFGEAWIVLWSSKIKGGESWRRFIIGADRGLGVSRGILGMDVQRVDG